MAKNTGIKSLIDKYLEQIIIEDADYVPFDNAESDAAYILLNVPIAMLKEYLKLKKQRKKLPDGAKFWKDSGLCKRLLNPKENGNDISIGHMMLKDFPDLLQELSGKVQGDYQDINNPERIRLSITEVPSKFYREA